jgi:biopolymer transport protein TolR
MGFHTFSSTSGAAGSLAGRAVPHRPFSDINVTPLVDVMLVLLVIFMVTAPLLSSTVGMELPRTPAARPDESPHRILVELGPEGRLTVGQQVLDPASLLLRLQNEARQNPTTEVQLRADQNVPYGKVVELIGLAQQAGLSRIGFVADAATANPLR